MTLSPGNTPNDAEGFWSRVLGWLAPAIYDNSWSPWLRLVITGALVFAGLVV
jgi:hypothetical protein